MTSHRAHGVQQNVIGMDGVALPIGAPGLDAQVPVLAELPE
jgi:hypothetical protein